MFGGNRSPSAPRAAERAVPALRYPAILTNSGEGISGTKGVDAYHCTGACLARGLALALELGAILLSGAVQNSLRGMAQADGPPPQRVLVWHGSASLRPGQWEHEGEYEIYDFGLTNPVLK